MNKGLFKVICVGSVLALIVAFGSPQAGKRKGTSGGGGGGGTTSTSGGSTGGTTTGGGSTGGSTTGGGLPGRRNEPPPRRTEGGGSGGGGGQSTTGGSVGTGGGEVGRREDRREDRGGRVDRGNQGGNSGSGRVIISGDSMGRRKTTDSRSGQVRYGTVNNTAGRIQVNGMRIERPAQIINPGMQRRVLDQERVGLVYNGWRNGYYHYNRNCQDDWFYYPHYVFNPWYENRFVCSPWYYYPSLPPYLNSSRIIIINAGWPSYNWSGSSYRWNRRNDNWNDRYERNRGELDYTIDDIIDAWERVDYRAIGRLIPRRGNVNMYFDGQYGYSLGAEDFYDLFVDGIENVRTDRYDILDVQRGRNGTVKILAKHDYADPWGRRGYTYHQYFLEEEGRGYVIREFGTSAYRTGW